MKIQKSIEIFFRFHLCHWFAEKLRETDCNVAKILNVLRYLAERVTFSSIICGTTAQLHSEECKGPWLSSQNHTVGTCRFEFSNVNQCEWRTGTRLGFLISRGIARILSREKQTGNHFTIARFFPKDRIKTMQLELSLRVDTKMTKNQRRRVYVREDNSLSRIVNTTKLYVLS